MMVSKVFLSELSLNFERIKQDYLNSKKMQKMAQIAKQQGLPSYSPQSLKQNDEVMLTKLDRLERDYEVGLKQKLEDTAIRIRQLGGVCEKAMFKCRKLEYFGDAGDIYFE